MTATTQIPSTEENPIRRTSIWILCALTVVLWSTASTMGMWFPLFAQNTNTGALDEIIYTFATMAAVFCWLLAVVLSWGRKNLGNVRWLPLGLLVGLIALNGLTHWGNSYQEDEVKKAALSGDRVKGYIKAESQTKEKVILAYFMDFPGTPPDDSQLLIPVTVTPMGSNYIGTDYGGGGAEQSTATGFYSLNKPKRLRWYIWHIKKNGQLFKGKDGIEHFDKTLIVDPKIPVVVCEATVPVYVSPIVQKIYSENFEEFKTKSWKVNGGSLIATFFGDGRTFALTASMGITANEDLNEDIMQHLHQGDCK